MTNTNYRFRITAEMYSATILLSVLPPACFSVLKRKKETSTLSKQLCRMYSTEKKNVFYLPLFLYRKNIFMDICKRDPISMV